MGGTLWVGVRGVHRKEVDLEAYLCSEGGGQEVGSPPLSGQFAAIKYNGKTQNELGETKRSPASKKFNSKGEAKLFWGDKLSPQSLNRRRAEIIMRPKDTKYIIKNSKK